MQQITEENYSNQLTDKVNACKSLFEKFDCPDFDIHTSPIKHFRMRAEFRIWHSYQEGKEASVENGMAHYCMTDKETKKLYYVDDLPIASETINLCMPKLLDAINQNIILRRKLFAVEFLSSTQNELLVTLIYHRKLDDEWSEEARKLQSELNISIIGRSRKQKVILEKDFIIESFKVNNKNFHFQQIENSFTQPNAHVNQKMLHWAHSCSKDLGGDLLELYCGNGNFTLPLSMNFNKVFATEISKTSVKALNWGLEKNNVNNIETARLSAEEMVEALNKVRPFTRLKNIDLDSYDFQTIFIDPPRAGLDEDTLHFVQNFKHIIYISCNPHTLASNLEALENNYHIEKSAIFDQFPYTDHAEMGIFLSRKDI